MPGVQPTKLTPSPPLPFRSQAPEQLDDRGHDTKVDMWALGVTCFYLLTNQHPFSVGLVLSDGPSIVDELDWNSYGLSLLGMTFLARARFCFFWGSNRPFSLLLATDFIQSLLVWNPERRLSSLEAANHPWCLTVGLF